MEYFVFALTIENYFLRLKQTHFQCPEWMTAFTTLVKQSKICNKIRSLKGFWQIPLTDRAKEISAFVTPDGLYQYKVMPFGMKNSPATFQRPVNMIITGLDTKPTSMMPSSTVKNGINR